MKKYIWMFFGVLLVAVIILVIFKREEGALKSPKSNHVFNDGDLEVEVVYGRPSKRDREIFGALVPYDKIWRTGANEATEFHTNRDLSFSGKDLPAGEYSVWTQPGSNNWKVYFNSTIPGWGVNENGEADHNPDTDVIILETPVQSSEELAEMFTITVVKTDSAYHMIMHWDKTKVTIPFTVK